MNVDGGATARYAPDLKGDLHEELKKLFIVEFFTLKGADLGKII